MDRWDALFAELESEAHANEVLDLHENARELANAEFSQLCMTDSLGAAVGALIAATTRSGARLSGELLGSAPEWIALRTPQGLAIIPMGCVAVVAGLPEKPRIGSSGLQGGGTEVSHSAVKSRVGVLSFSALMRRLHSRRMRMRFVVGANEIVGVLRGVARDYVVVDQALDGGSVHGSLAHTNERTVAVLNQHIEVVFC